MAKLGNASEQDEELRPDYSDLIAPLDALPTEDDTPAPDDCFGVEFEALTTAVSGADEDEPLDVGCLVESEIDDASELEEGPSLFAASECAGLLLVPESEDFDEEDEGMTEGFDQSLSVPPELPSEPPEAE